MTISKTARPKPGDQIFFKKTGLTIPGPYEGIVSRIGQTITVTAQLIESSLNRNGDSWLDLIDDEDAQIARYGTPAFARGAAPADMYLFTPGSAEEDLAREEARQSAHAIPDPSRRAEALARVYRTFGRKTTSKTLWVTSEERATTKGDAR